MSKASIGRIPIEKIAATAELDRLGFKWQVANTAGEIAFCCPCHDDQSPSALLSTSKNLWTCHAAECKASGDIISLLAHIARTERAQIITDLSARYDLGLKRIISPVTVETFHGKIWTSGPLLQELYNRGVTDELIRKARLGYHDGRITIPVYDESRNIVNVRRYKPGAPGPEKMKNTTGYGTPPHLYQIEQLAYETVWICGGEMKALVASAALNPLGVGVVAATAGEGSWEHTWTKLLKGKRVFLCMDIDLGGKMAARRLAGKLCFDSQAVRTIRLPLNPENFPKGDVNDWVVSAKPTTADWEKLMADAELFQPEELLDEPDGEIIETKLVDAAKAANMSKQISVDAVIQAMDTAPFLAPKTVAVECDRAQPNCHWCPVRPLKPDEKTGKTTLTVRSTSPAILDIVNAPKIGLREATREALRIPECKVAEFTVKDHYDVLDVRLTPQLQMGGSNTDHVVQPALIVNQEQFPIDLNTPYVMTGRVYPHPKTQQAILLLNHVKQAEDSLSSFKPEGEELETLRVFQCENLQEKLDEIYTDFEANVTRIFYRRELHLVIDLVYHSVLHISFDGQIINGWANAVIVGDSSQGKSEASQRIMGHYSLGERVDMKNATPAGLIGGLQQLGNRWFVSWGVIPIHDRRAVLLDEVKGGSMECVSKLTDMRSSGVAEIPKIEKRRAHARTRLIFMSNPRFERPVSKYNFGVETIAELMGAPEDIRRCDVGLVLSAMQINPESINKLLKDRPQTEHKYTGELCRRLVLWAWTRTADQIQFDRDAERACMDEAMSLQKQFSDAMPLIDKGTTRYKLARLAAALAARVFSTDQDDLNVLRVKESHVRFIAQKLREWYSSPTFGYDDYSKAQEFSETVIDPNEVRRVLLATKHPKDIVQSLLHVNEITVIDIKDWGELDHDSASALLSMLVRKHAVKRDNKQKCYIKTKEFIDLLKKMHSDGVSNHSVTDSKEKY